MGAGVIGLLAEFAEVVVVGCENIAAVMSVTFHFCDYIEALVIVKEFILHINLNSLGH